jgi:hypothetical protein
MEITAFVCAALAGTLLIFIRIGFPTIFSS